MERKQGIGRSGTSFPIDIHFLLETGRLAGRRTAVGVARNDASPDDLSRSTIEKPWIAVVETFAIGGGCQHLLVMDYVLADAHDRWP